MRALSMCIVLGAPLAGCAVQVRVFDDSIRPAAVSDRIDWKQAEKGILENHRQLTFADRFVKAGEAYFSPDDSRIIFQAVGVPPAGEAADEFYAMFIADLVRDDAGRITGLDDIIRISPPGSANTCGWFHPTDPNEVIFASTIGPPSEATPPGFERLSGRYRWMFPPQMKIVRCRLDATAGAGLAVTSRVFTRFGLGWIDFDNDGWLDLYEANGRVTIIDMAEPNLLFRGTAEGRFEEVTPRGGTAQTLMGVSRAAAFGDIDNDGAVDVLVVNRDGTPYLLHNRAGRGGHWIMFRVLDERGSDAIGATITMVVGDRSVIRDVRTAYSYLAANDPRVHVGLGEAGGVTDVVVRWVGGVRESFGSLPADAVHTLRRGEGDELQDAAESRSSPAETR